MLESFPYIPLFASVRLAVAIFSYDGALSFGVSGDYDTAPDIDVLCEGIELGLDELVALSESEAEKPAGKPRGPGKSRGAGKPARSRRAPASRRATVRL